MTPTPFQSAPEQLATLLAELRHARRQREITQATLATRLHVVYTSLANWEMGRGNPTATHLVHWSRELGRRITITDQGGNEQHPATNNEVAWDQPYEQRELKRLYATLRTIRTQQHITQAPLVTALGVGRRTITRWETAAGNPRAITLAHWARTLECNIRLQRR